MNKRVRMVRKSRKLNQQEFGSVLGVTATAISKIEMGENSVTPQMIRSICREYSVNERWLRDGEGEMFNETDDAIVDQLVAERGLDEFGARAIRAYLKMPQTTRSAIKDYILSVAASYGASITPEDTTSNVIDMAAEEAPELFRAARSESNTEAEIIIDTEGKIKRFNEQPSVNDESDL